MAVTVTFGGALGTNVQVASDTELTVTTPAHAAGVVDVVVSTSGGSDTLTDGYSYEAPVLTVTVPTPNDVVAGETFEYTTRLQNTGTAATGVYERISFHSDTRALTEADITYETHDSGSWVEVDFTVEGGDLVFTETLPHIEVDKDSTSQVRITVNADDLPVVEGTSILGYPPYPGGYELDRAEYVFNVEVPPPPTLTAVDPSTSASTLPQTWTVTGTGLDQVVDASPGADGYFLGITPNPTGGATDPMTLAGLTVVSATELTFDLGIAEGVYDLVIVDSDAPTVPVATLSDAITVDVP